MDNVSILRAYRKLRPLVAEGRGVLLCKVGIGGIIDEAGKGNEAIDISEWLNTTGMTFVETRITNGYVFYVFEDAASCTLFKMAFDLTQTVDGFILMGTPRWGQL